MTTPRLRRREGDVTTQPREPWQPPAEPDPPYGTDPGRAPSTVRVAAILLFVVIGLGLLNLVTLPDVLENAIKQQEPRAAQAGGLLDAVVSITTLLVVLAAFLWAGVQVLFVVKAWHGRNWARIVLTVILAVGLLGFVVTAPQYVTGVAEPFNTVLAVPDLLAHVVALVLLWHEPAAGWYPAMTAHLKVRRTTRRGFR